MKKQATVIERSDHGFKGSLPLLEEFLQPEGTYRWGGLTGRGLKEYLKSGARAAADCFTRDAGKPGNRAFLRLALEGSGINPVVAADIAANSPAGDGSRKCYQKWELPNYART